MLTVVFDASPLITACKFKTQGKLVIDYLLSGSYILITPSVEEEVAVLGAGYSDGVIAGERIVQSSIQVIPLTVSNQAQYLSSYALGDGEKDSIELCSQLDGVEALVTDDYLAFVAATRLGLTVWMLPDLILNQAKQGSLTVKEAEAILNVIRPRYRMGVIEHTLAQLREVKQDG